MGTDFSQAGLFPAPLKDLPLPRPPTPLPHPLPKGGSLPASGGEECVALPGMLAAAPPLGSKIRTIWWSEGSQDSAQREATLSSVAAPRRLDDPARGRRHGETAPVGERCGRVAFETQHISEFVLLPSFSCFYTHFL